ncbi:hypothetical protein C8Q75DRAFT_527156 [Abortiporus biennis]|nr:hypothetical protein C8Q75DRAFT_527156 [Abortiporus biennis]
MWGNVCTNLVVRYLEHEHKLRHSANLCCCPHDQLSPPIPASLSQFGAPDEVTTTMFYSLIYPYNPVMPKNPLPDLNIFSTESKLQGSYGILKSLELDPAHFYCSHEDMYDHYGSFTPFPLTSSLPSSSQTGSMSLSASPLLSDSPRQILSESPPPPTLPLAGILPDSFNMLLFDAHVPASPRSQNLGSPVVQPNSFAADEAPHSTGDTFGQQSALSHPPHNAGDEEDFSDTEDASQSSSPLRPRIPVSPCPYVRPTYGKTKPDGERSWRAPGPTPPTTRRSSKRHSPVASSSSLSKHPEVIDLTSAEVRTVELPLTPVSMASKASPLLSEEEIEEEEQPRLRGGRKRKSPVDEDDEDSEYEPSAERHATGGLTIPSMKKRRKVKTNPNGKKKKMTFSCEYCDQRFTRLADKERHIQTACTAEGALERRVTHDCPTCAKSFARIDAMKRHYFTKHKK